MQEGASKYKLRSGPDGATIQEIEVNPKDYELASRSGLTLSQYLTRKYRDQTDESRFGSVFSQCLASAGMFLRADEKTGLRAPTLKEVMSDSINMAGIVGPSGDNVNTPSARLLYPETILRVMEAELRTDESDFLSTYNRMFANTLTIDTEKFDQPVINSTHNENTRSKAISQGTEPGNMVGITVGDISRRVPVKSIGLTVTDQAMAATTLDLVTLIMSAQSRGERIANAHEILNGILAGDVDMAETGVPSAGTFQALDAAITTAGAMSHKALVKFLRENYKKLQPNLLIMDLDAAFAVEARSGKPTRNTNFNGDGTNFGLEPNVDNLLATAPPILIVEGSVVGANTIVGLDTRYAMRRVINVNAAYSAIEQFVMRRITAFRVDYGETAYTLYKEAFQKRTLTV